MLAAAEARLGFNLRVLQGSYNRGGVSASAGTHDGGGAVDVSPTRNPSQVVRALREVGFAAWHRLPSQGPWTEHIHAIAIGDPEMSSGAHAQVSAYYNRRNGLANNGPDDGPHLSPIPTWPIYLPSINLANVQRQFKAKRPKKLPGVQRIQKMLNIRMGTHLLEDGVAGPKTRAAWRKWELKFKENYKDGIPGPRELGVLVAGHYRVI